ncbi:hypothetical protein [Thiohalorhabdus sp.]|uniref:hypothetical protein n=1 Tax=Thiohalorhabdus sp. TaxID=3094134 RepID=UPI002FC2C4AA
MCERIDILQTGIERIATLAGEVAEAQAIDRKGNYLPQQARKIARALAYEQGYILAASAVINVELHKEWAHKAALLAEDCVTAPAASPFAP